MKNEMNGYNLTAQSFLNIRVMVNLIKKQVYLSSKRLMFEQNDDILWLNFRSLITPLLDKMLAGEGISGYKLLKVSKNERGTLAAKIIIVPIEAVEKFEVTVVLTDSLEIIE